MAKRKAKSSSEMPAAMIPILTVNQDLLRTKALELGRVGPRTILFVSTKKAFAKNSKNLPSKALSVQVTDEDYDEVLDALNKLVPRTGKKKISEHARKARFFSVRLSEKLPPAARAGGAKRAYDDLAKKFSPPQPSSFNTAKYVMAGGVTTAALAGALGVYACQLPAAVIDTVPGLAAKCAPSALQAARAYVGV